MPNIGNLYQDTKATPESDLEEHTHPFGAGTFGAKYVVSPIPSSFNSIMNTDKAGRTDGNFVYVGYNMRGASNSDTNWIIQKITYDADGDVETKRVGVDSWDNRASATYT